ncbi:MAG: flagellar protein FlgN [Syntrophales bacterium LBB04]|nr:flagellar protein FlgN [Syntrophales bacterium LBB04]
MLITDINQEYMRKDGDMEGLLDSLLSVLTKEIEIYEELQAAIVEEGISLKRPSLETISESNAKKETIILKARMLEEVRGNIVKKIAKIYDIEEKDVNLTFLTSYVGGNRKNKLKSLQTVLSKLIFTINKNNENNIALLDFSISYVKSTMNFLNNLLSTGADYINTGKLKAAKMNGKLLYKEG